MHDNLVSFNHQNILLALSKFNCMTSKTIKKKVIEYITHAEDNVIEAVYNMLKIYEDSDGRSAMTNEQKTEIERRSSLYRKGELKTSTWNDVKKRTRIK